MPKMKVSTSTATDADAPSIAGVRNAVAAQLGTAYGEGPWSSRVTDDAVLRELRQTHVLVAQVDGSVVATLRLASKKPWAIDTAYFSSVPKAVYLCGMAVDPAFQRRAIGRKLVSKAKALARSWPSDAIRLDAYDSPAGAGPFYVSCGFREVGRAVYRGVPLVYLELLL